MYCVILKLKVLKIASAAGLILLLGYLISQTGSFIEDKRMELLRVSTYDNPYSADPMDFDFTVHQHIFRSVFANLITQYSSGQFSGIIAQFWKSSDDYKIWTFSNSPEFAFFQW